VALVKAGSQGRHHAISRHANIGWGERKAALEALHEPEDWSYS
jgi:hypothetical protein